MAQTYQVKSMGYPSTIQLDVGDVHTIDAAVMVGMGVGADSF